VDESSRQRWHWAVILLGAVYLGVGIAFGALAGWSSSNQMRVTWRLLAWLISGAAFAAHIGYEHVRLRNSPATTALHVSLAVGLGAFALAAAATIHGQVSGASHQSLRVLALVLWPVLTAVPAFVVALGSAALLALRRRGV
jgi:hypothetical protein